MTIMRKLLFLSALLLAGCATRPPPAPAPARFPPVVVEPETAVLAPADHLTVSVSRSLLLVRASELVASRDPSLRPLAERIAADHRGIAAQWNLAGRRLNLLPSAQLSRTDALQLSLVSRSEDIARAYRALLASALDHCVRLEGAFAMRGTSPTLRPVARFAEGVCREELEALR
jgi:hypothetical protein